MIRYLAPVLIPFVLAACAGMGSDATAPGGAGQTATVDAGPGDRRTERSVAAAGSFVPDRHAEEFIGSSRRDLVAWLGQPDLELREGERSLLQFRQGRCVVLVMVEAGDGVAAVEMSGIDGGTDTRCADSTLPKVMTQ
ncbi:MAG: hypothetical protein P1U65_18840 [Minwuia sp.]|nr:hypothetical protein [Minwuia sp.]